MFVKCQVAYNGAFDVIELWGDMFITSTLANGERNGKVKKREAPMSVFVIQFGE